MTHSFYVYISLAFLIARYHITWRRCLYDNLISLNNNKTYLYLHVKCPYFCPILIKFGIFFTDFSLKSPVPNFMEICPVRAALIHSDRQMDITKVIVAFWHNWTLLKEGFHFLYGMIWLEVTVNVVYLYTICPDYHILEKYSLNASFMADNLWIINLLVFKLQDQSLSAVIGS